MHGPVKKDLVCIALCQAFFLLGAALEFTMINWQVGQTSFYGVYQKRQARNIAEAEVLPKH